MGNLIHVYAAGYGCLSERIDLMLGRGYRDFFLDSGDTLN